ncbi:MAG: hypothetical protein JWN90_10 [Parcubacteria group bacterium]|nr:hypothetical protein [Parcubacteria group bacterium]
MDIEELSKSQLLLLTVMVNFVVSIATAVLTVSMVDNAPLTVTQTVNRIVDHTIETISTPIQVVNPIKTPTSKPTPTNEQLLTTAVSNDLARTALIYKGATTTPAIAFGVYLPKSRAIATAFVLGLPKEAMIQFSDGSVEQASLSRSDDNLAIYGFADDAKLPSVPDAGLPAASTLKQGQTVAAITKDSAATTGIISKVSASEIQTTITGVPVGAGVVELSGLVIGIGSTKPGVLISADLISALLASPASK